MPHPLICLLSSRIKLTTGCPERINRGPLELLSQKTAGQRAKSSAPMGWARMTLVACIMGVAACGGPSSDESVARAELQLASKDYPTAIVELKSALAAGSKEELPRIHWLLGKAYLDSDNMSSAERELEQARQLGWNPNDVLPALAKSLLAQEKYAPLEELPITALEPSAKAQILASQALAQLAQGDIWDADSLVAEALELQPNDIEVRLAEVRAIGAMGDIAGALAAVEQVLDTDLDNPVAWSLKGELLRLQQQLPEAQTALDTAIELAPDNLEERSKRALINLQLQDLDAMRVDAAWLLEAAPKNPMSNYVQGLLRFYDGDYTGSITFLELAVSMEPRYPLVDFYLSAAHLMQGHQTAATSVARRLVDLHPGFAPGRKLLASLYLQAGDARDVPNLLRPVLDHEPDDGQALNLMANALLLDGKTDQSLDLLARLQQLQPDSAEANFRLGAGLLLAGRDKAATQQLEKALTLDPQYQQADILLILRLLEEQDFSAAIEAAQAYRSRNPDSVTPYSLLGRVYLANAQAKEARAAFSQALTIAPGDPAANHALAQMAQQSGDDTLARKYYQTVLDHRADYLPALLQLALITAGEDNEAELVAQLNHAQEVHPDALEPRLMLGRYYLWKKTPANIPPLFSALTELQQQSPEVLHLLALAQLADQRPSDAVATLEQLVRAKPGTPLAHHLLGTAAAGSGDFNKAREEFQRVLALDENYFPALVSLARLAWADGDTPQFEQYLQRLVVVAAEAPDVLRLRAAAAWRAGDQEQAIELAGRARTDAPSTDTTLELAGYQFMAGNSTEALRAVETWVAEQPGDVRARIALASQLSHSGNNDQAVKQYQAVLKLEPNNTTALNNLAWYLRTSQPQQALDFARRAVSIEPNAPQLMDTLAVLEHLTGDDLQAQRHIKRAVAASPGNPAVLYHQAQIETALGNKDAAIGILENVLARPTPTFNERDEAIALLASLRE